MFYVSNYTFAVVLCVVCMFCWGSWGNTQKLAGKTWRYELFYWDYVIGLLGFSLVAGLTFGSFGEHAEWGFLANLKSSFGASWLWPLAAGIVFNLSNILLSAAIAVAGMSVAFPVGVGLALVGGTVFNYLFDPAGKPLGLIVAGLALIVVSIVCNAMAFKAKAEVGRAAEGAPVRTGLGLALAIFAGLLMMWFSPLVNKVIDNTFAANAPAAGKMTAYTAFFVFAIGIFVSNFLWNTIAMRHPVQGEPITDGAKRYFAGSFKTHLVGALGGAIWSLGTLLSFVTAGAASPAIAYALGQGATLVSALWGILIWKEFAGAPKKSAVLNFAMFVLFVAGLAVLIKAGENPEREPVKVIFDTDMLTDFDDVGALACLHALADAGECEILATVSCTRGNASVGAVEVINSYYGRGDLPVGCAKEIGVIGDAGRRDGHKATAAEIAAMMSKGRGGGDGGHYKYRKLCADYPQWVKHADSDEAPDANEVYRKVLAAQPDHSVTICSVGFLTNLRRLLETKGDAFSPLDGRALVAKKVKLWVAMACNYPIGQEYNSKLDWESSKIVLENWPTPVVFSDFQYGMDTFAGRAVAEQAGPRNPVKDVFAGNIPSREAIRRNAAGNLRSCNGMGGRAAWDETAVLAAVRGADSYFNVHRGSYRMIGDKGDDEWSPDEENGPHVRLTEKVSKLEVARIIDELICRGPKHIR